VTGVSVVLPNYDGAALLRRYLSGVLAAAGEYGDSEVIVVDDGSADDSVAVLIAEFPGVQVIRHPRNLGFQAACNTGAGAARCGLLLFLNTDMRVGPGLLAAMARHFSDDSVFAVAARSLVTTSGTPPVARGGPWNESITTGEYRRGWLLVRHPGIRPGEDTCGRFGEPRPILYAPEVALMCRRDRFLALGGFDTIYATLTVEDLDLCYRAWKRHWTVLYEPGALVHHEHSATIGRVGGRRRRRIMARSFFLFPWRNLTDRRLLREHLTWLGPRLALALARGEQAWVTGFVLALGRSRAALRGRAVESKEAQVGDREVMRRACGLDGPR